MKNFGDSPLWDSILRSKHFEDIDLNNFKNEDANSRITQYSTKTHGLLFLKNLMFQMAQSFENDHLSLLNKIPNRSIGRAATIIFNNIEFDLDYLLSLEEIIFLQKNYVK